MNISVTLMKLTINFDLLKNPHISYCISAHCLSLVGLSFQKSHSGNRLMMSSHLSQTRF